MAARPELAALSALGLRARADQAGGCASFVRLRPWASMHSVPLPRATKADPFVCRWNSATCREAPGSTADGLAHTVAEARIPPITRPTP